MGERMPIGEYVKGRKAGQQGSQAPGRTARAPVRKHTPGVMNKLEAAYADWLDAQKADGSIAEWWFEPVKFTLAHKTGAARSKFITPDFMVQLPDGTIELHDTKPTKADGSPYITEDAKEKMRWLADKYPFPCFYVHKRKRSKELGKHQTYIATAGLFDGPWARKQVA